MQKFYGIFAIFGTTFAIGYSYFQYTSTKNPYQINRDPAAISKVFDFSHLRGEKLQEAAKQRLITGFELRKTAEGTGVGLGHFSYVDVNGEKKFACQEFKRVTLTFEGVGSAVSSDIPQMDVQGACDFSRDTSKINPLYIPVAKILGENPADGNFESKESAQIIRFKNIPDEWPRTWVLKSVKLENETGSEVLVVESNDVAQYLGHPVVLSW